MGKINAQTGKTQSFEKMQNKTIKPKMTKFKNKDESLEDIQKQKSKLNKQKLKELYEDTLIFLLESGTTNPNILKEVRTYITTEEIDNNNSKILLEIVEFNDTTNESK